MSNCSLLDIIFFYEVFLTRFFFFFLNGRGIAPIIAFFLLPLTVVRSIIESTPRSREFHFSFKIFCRVARVLIKQSTIKKKKSHVLRYTRYCVYSANKTNLVNCNPKHIQFHDFISLKAFVFL